MVICMVVRLLVVVGGDDEYNDSNDGDRNDCDEVIMYENVCLSLTVALISRLSLCLPLSLPVILHH